MTFNPDDPKEHRFAFLLDLPFARLKLAKDAASKSETVTIPSKDWVAVHEEIVKLTRMMVYGKML